MEPRLSVLPTLLATWYFSVVFGALETDYAFSRFLSLSTILQVDTANVQAASANIRLRWNYRPDSDLYVIYTAGQKFASLAAVSPTRFYSHFRHKIHIFPSGLDGGQVAEPSVSSSVPERQLWCPVQALLGRELFHRPPLCSCGRALLPIAFDSAFKLPDLHPAFLSFALPAAPEALRFVSRARLWGWKTSRMRGTFKQLAQVRRRGRQQGYPEVTRRRPMATPLR